MKARVIGTLVSVLLLSAPAGGKNPEPKFKSVEVTHFTKQEGVELPPEFLDFLYAELTKELKKSGVFEQIVGEGEVVESADASRSVTLGGSVLEFGKGSLKKRMIPIAGPAGAGGKTIRVQIKLLRKSDNQTLLGEEVKQRVPYEIKAQALAVLLARRIAKDIKKGLAK